MHQASVGFHCPECTKSGKQKVVRAGQLHTKPIVTNFLIAANLAIFVAGIGSGLETKNTVIFDGGLIGDAITGRGELIGVANGEWYRIVTSGFLHANAIHIGFNCLVLYQLGQLMEPVLGRLRFAVAYGVAMLSGALGVLILDPNQFTVGASGAVFGLFGATFVIGKRLNLDVRWVIGLIALNLAFTFVIPLISSQNISWQGHIGGLVTGAGIAAAYVYAPRANRALIQWGVTAAVLVVFALLIWWRTYELLAVFG